MIIAFLALLFSYLSAPALPERSSRKEALRGAENALGELVGIGGVAVGGHPDLDRKGSRVLLGRGDVRVVGGEAARLEDAVVVHPVSLP